MAAAKRPYTRAVHEEYLNGFYTHEMSLSEALNQLEYLANPARGAHTTRQNIAKCWEKGTLGTLLRKYDSIAFECSFNDTQ